eukprot:NODE_418_length_8967_cov_0.347429.p4 type:complete len:201 gc:universal NODE_418_length_8967_cov_0.347429:4496-5098(+)
MEQVAIKLGTVEISVKLEPNVLQISQLPPDTTAQHIKEILSDLLEIENIVFFNDRYRLDEPIPLYVPIDIPLWVTGSYCRVFYKNIHPDFIKLLVQRKWITRKEITHYVDIKTAEKEATDILEFFDAPFEKSSVIDEDGFTMVTSKRKAPISNRVYEKSDFYRFQMKDSKKRKLTELQDKFNDDKLKIMKMKMNNSNINK